MTITTITTDGIPHRLLFRNAFSKLVRLGFLVLLCLFFASCDQHKVRVLITNRTGGEITDVKLKFTGGHATAARIKIDESHETFVRAASESHLEIEFTDAGGQSHSKEIGVYFERGYKGSVIIFIESGGRVSWKENIGV